MPITYDDLWESGTDKHSRVKQVYCDGECLGRVRLWQPEEPRDLTGEWFTVERWDRGLYVPQEGMHSEFEEALEQVALYCVAH